MMGPHYAVYYSSLSSCPITVGPFQPWGFRGDIPFFM